MGKGHCRDLSVLVGGMGIHEVGDRAASYPAL